MKDAIKKLIVLQTFFLAAATLIALTSPSPRWLASLLLLLVMASATYFVKIVRSAGKRVGQAELAAARPRIRVFGIVLIILLALGQFNGLIQLFGHGHHEFIVPTLVGMAVNVGLIVLLTRLFILPTKRKDTTTLPPHGMHP